MHLLRSRQWEVIFWHSRCCCMPRNIHSRFSKTIYYCQSSWCSLVNFTFPQSKHQGLRERANLFIFSWDKRFSHYIHFDEHLSRCVCFSFVGFFAFVFPLMVYPPAVSVFEVLVPNKRPPMLRDGVCQWRRGTCVSAFVFCVSVFSSVLADSLFL